VQGTSKLHKSKSAPTLLRPADALGTTSAAQEGRQQSLFASIPSSAEAQPEELPLLGPVPANFDRAYDYLGKVKPLAEDIEPGFFDTLFEQHFPSGWGSVRCFTSMGPSVYGISGKVWCSHEVVQLRDIATNADEQNPCVLVVESIGKSGVQALGMAFDVDLCFFARHINDLNDPFHEYMRTLKESFVRFVQLRNQSGIRDNHPLEIPTHITATTVLRGSFLSYVPEQDWIREAIWAPIRRRDLISAGRFSRPRISCCQVSQHSCKDLLALMFTLSRLVADHHNRDHLVRLHVSLETGKAWAFAQR
jgi:hypothetical protein